MESVPLSTLHLVLTMTRMALVLTLERRDPFMVELHCLQSAISADSDFVHEDEDEDGVLTGPLEGHTREREGLNYLVYGLWYKLLRGGLWYKLRAHSLH